MIVNQVAAAESSESSLISSMQDIEKTLIQVTALQNNSAFDLTTVRLTVDKLERDFRQSVLDAIQYEHISEDVRKQAGGLKEKILGVKKELNIDPVDSTGPKLKLDLNLHPDPNVTASWASYNLLQVQGQRLIDGSVVYPHFLTNYRNTCTDATLCTAAFLLNQEHHVDRTKLRLDGNNTFDLFEAASEVDSSWKPQLFTAFDSSLFSQLNPTQIYIVRNGQQGGVGHFSVWFNARGNWYQSKDPRVGLLQLTDRGRITSQAQQYFIQQSKNYEWGEGFGKYGIHALTLYSDVAFNLLSQQATEMK